MTSLGALRDNTTNNLGCDIPQSKKILTVAPVLAIAGVWCGCIFGPNAFWVIIGTSTLGFVLKMIP